MAEARAKTHSITVRLTETQHSELHAATAQLPYEVSVTQIIIRGIRLASDEIASIAAILKDGTK